MAQNDTLAAALSKMSQYERLGRGSVTLTPASKIITAVLDLFKDAGYIDGYEKHAEGEKTTLTVTLNGTINGCGVIKPRFSVGKDGIEKFEQRFLPSRDMGILAVSTTGGIIDHRVAKEKHIGGKLIAYCY